MPSVQFVTLNKLLVPLSDHYHYQGDAKNWNAKLF